MHAAIDPDSLCPRCQQAFHCGVDDEPSCPCADLTLSPQLQERLRLTYQGCLCLRCLAELARVGQ